MKVLPYYESTFVLSYFRTNEGIRYLFPEVIKYYYVVHVRRGPTRIPSFFWMEVLPEVQRTTIYTEIECLRRFLASNVQYTLEGCFTVQVGEHHGVLVPLVAHYVLVDFEKLFGTHLPSQFLTNRRVALSENRMTPC